MVDRKTIRERLAKLLRAEGYFVEAYDLHAQSGYWRSRSELYGICRWYSHRVIHDDNEAHIASWDTMTECVRHGISVSPATDHDCAEVCANDKPQSFPVTDSDMDAPDGAVVEGYERHGSTWEKL